ncbi:MAG TPA: inositol monophosphatase family protein, partial [Stellaceae bacterium]|nr:inositol monophosphatase family protein [Stellaceae bacterium]
MTAEHRLLLDMACAAAHAAGAAILDIYCQDFTVRQKADDSPVTRADERAEAIIEERLAAGAPDIPVIAEERCAAQGLPSVAPPRFWLVDPLDGTKEFIRRNGEFTVNIALIEGDRPVLGVVHVPSQGVTYAGAGDATRWRNGEKPQPIKARPV